MWIRESGGNGKFWVVEIGVNECYDKCGVGYRR